MPRQNRLTEKTDSVSRRANSPAAGSANARGRFSRLVDRIIGGAAPEVTSRGRLLLETLEKRQLMAGDVDLFATDGVGAAETTHQTPPVIAGRTAEGESAPDLVAFAELLDQAGARFYGGDWCEFCRQQKELFSDGRDNLPYIEVTNPDRSFNSVGIAEGIQSLPTWDFASGQRVTGVQSLETLAALAGVTIPTSDTPTFEPIGDQTVGIGSPLHVVVDGYDPGDGPLTTTVSVADPTLVEAVVLTGNRSIRINVEGYGAMTFQLFEQRAPNTTGQIIQLVEDGFYDVGTHVNPIEFHRVIDNFVLQAGDPTGTGSSGSTLPDVDDEFHPDLQHNREGILSFAKAGDDTNNSQFFITEGPTRHLDFNHSVLGQLVEGFDVREAISRTTVNSENRPINPIRITSVEVFTDQENSVVMLRPIGNTTGATQATFTVTDPDGNSHSESIDVFVVADSGASSDSQPYLNDITPPAAVPNDQTATLQLSSIDVEGDPVTYLATNRTTNVNAVVSVDSSTGLVEVTAPTGFEGTVDVEVRVRRATGTSGDFDSQVVPFTFSAATGNSVTAVTDAFTVPQDSSATLLDVLNNDLPSGQSLTISAVTQPNAGGTVALSNNQIRFTPTAGFNGPTSFNYTVQNSTGQTDSGTVTINVTANATFDFVTPPPEFAFFDEPFAYDVNLDGLAEDGNNVYELISPPTGATIDPTTGLINWTPTSAQQGDVSMNIRVTNGGNVVTERSFNLTVDQASVAFELDVTNLDGSPVSGIEPGDEFFVTLVARDARRLSRQRLGVFSAFASVTFDSSVVQAIPGSLEHLAPWDDADFIEGIVTPTSVINIGSTLGSTSETDQEFNSLARIRFRAIAPGDANLQTAEADSSLETLLFGEDSRFSAEDISFAGANVQVTSNFFINDDSFTVAEDSSATSLDVLQNDIRTGNTGDFSVTAVTQPTSGGTVTLNNGAVTFTPDANFVGTATFTYTAQVTGGQSGTGTVSVEVTSVNDNPVAVDDSFTVGRGESDRTLDVLANDTTGPDTGETLIITDVGTPSAGGTVTISSDQTSLIYTPAADSNGNETFTYVISDGGLTSVATVTILLDAAPTANDDAFTVTEDASEASFDVTANDTADVDIQSFSLLSVDSVSAGGTATVSADGTLLLYRPAANFAGVESVTYTIEDTGGGRSSATVRFTVTPVNDPPPATTTDVTFIRDDTTGPRRILTVAQLPANVDAGEALTFVNVTSSNSSAGTVSIDSNDGSIQYEPVFSTTGAVTDVVTYTVRDADGLESTGTINLRIESYERFRVLIEMDGVDGSNPLLNFGDQVRITGTNVNGETIDIPASLTNAELAVDNLLPGDYEVEIPAVPFLQNGDQPQRFTLSRSASAASDADEVVRPTFGRIRPEFLSIRDWLGSASRTSVLVAVAPGEGSLITIPSDSVDHVEQLQGTLDADGQSLTLRGVDPTQTDASAANVQAVVSVGDESRIQSRGEVNGTRLYRVNLDETTTAFTPTGSTATSAAAGTSLAGTDAALADTGDANDIASLLAQDAGTDTSVTDQAIQSDFGDG